MEISTSDAKKLMNNQGVIFLDVRTLDERNQKKVSGSIHVDIFDNDFEEKIKLLDKSKEYVVYCRSGGRSAQAVSFMLSLGFNAKNLVGGMNDW